MKGLSGLRRRDCCSISALRNLQSESPGPCSGSHCLVGASESSSNSIMSTARREVHAKWGMPQPGAAELRSREVVP